jgi:predicted ArsR family transcriptional regulator
VPALFDPKEEERSLVRALSGLGVPQEDIATHLEIDAKTLRKHFRRELDRGMVEANVKVAQSLFQMATTGKNVAAAIFWMKARCGRREKHEVTVSPAEEEVERLSDEELQRLIRSYADSKGLVLLERDARAA